MTAVAASDSAGSSPFPEPALADVVLEGAITAALVLPGFAILAIAARWLSGPGAGVTLAVMVALSGWTALEMWDSPNALDGLMILFLMLAIPPVAAAGVVLDLGGRALVRRLQTAGSLRT